MAKIREVELMFHKEEREEYYDDGKKEGIVQKNHKKTMNHLKKHCLFYNLMISRIEKNNLERYSYYKIKTREISL